ncbi:type IV secretion system DNA-binding domain-containing protein [Chondrinema litorale]|uniref:type IV secretion system DNA-binding domain-containing protein n=1 Tax=Chondrinema litorale TaxID=2994555 RepID=UPI002542939A|nr:type IV secretion system DNA-binding domain-containing protein [Chondrinema litorale]UZR99829.1 type IV secretion system DNA-binding domain-containing protein [Chondrinema litorale]
MVFIQFIIIGVLLVIWLIEMNLTTDEFLAIYHQIPVEIIKKIFLMLTFLLPSLSIFIACLQKSSKTASLITTILAIALYTIIFIYFPIILPFGLFFLLMSPLILVDMQTENSPETKIKLPTFIYQDIITTTLLILGSAFILIESYVLYSGLVTVFFDSIIFVVLKLIILIAFAFKWKSHWQQYGGNIFLGVILLVAGVVIQINYYSLLHYIHQGYDLIIYSLMWLINILGIIAIFNLHDHKRKVKFKIHRKVNSHMALSMKYLQGGWLNITDWTNHILLIGGSGFGKTTILKQIVHSFILNKRCGIIVDYKQHDIAETAYATYLEKYGKYNLSYPFYYLSFHNPEHSLGCNPLKEVDNMAKAKLVAMTLHKNLARAEDTGNAYFSDSAESLLAAIIFFLKESYPAYCTIPHLIRLVCHFELEKVLPMMAENIDIQPMVADIRSCITNGAGEQASGTLGKLRSFLTKIDDKPSMYLLTRNDFSLDLNNNVNGGVLAIGCNEDMQTVYSPLISTIVSIGMNKMRNRGKREWFVLFEELSKYIIPDLNHILTTVREGGGSIIAALQNSHTYGLELKNTAEEFFQGFYNLIVMNSKGKTAKEMSEIFGDDEVDEKSETKQKGSDKTSSTTRKVNKPRVKPGEFSDLRKGEVIASTQTKEGYRLLSKGRLKYVQHPSKKIGNDQCDAVDSDDFENKLSVVQKKIVDEVELIVNDAKSFCSGQNNRQSVAQKAN